MFHVDWFWLFVLGISVVGVVSSMMRTRERERTIRAAIDKGVALDPALLESFRAQAVAPTGSSRFGLLIGGIMTFFIGIGLALMGVLIDVTNHTVIWPLIATGALLWCISAGLFVASRFAPGPRTP